MPITVEALQQGLITHDKGVLKRGAHKPQDHEFCALEFSAIMRGQTMNDTPGDLPDLRPLNDAAWSSDAARTTCMLPVLAALWDWREWPETRKQTWTTRIVVGVVQRIIAPLPRLSPQIAEQCQQAQTLTAARAAAGAAADVAADAARAADRVLMMFCTLCVQAATQREGE